MTQFVILFTLMLPVGHAPHRIWVYGKPVYNLHDQGACHEAASAVVKRVFEMARMHKFKDWKAVTTCTITPQVDA